MNKVSVIIPVYNVEDYLAECLDSVLGQTYTEMEILAVNDGSKDGSRAILEGYARKDTRLRILDKVNGGLSDARNFGIDHANGDYYVFVDSDDVISETMVEDLVTAAVNTGAEIAVCDMEYFYEDGRRIFSSGGSFDCCGIKDSPSLIAINNSACNKLFHKSLFLTERFPLGKYYEDLYLIPVLMYQSTLMVKVDKPLYYYRQRSGSIAHSANKKIFDIYDALNHIREYVEKHGNEDAVIKEIHHLYIVHGLDLTTLRIRDFDDCSIRSEYLQENMALLKAAYPDYRKDEAYKKAGLKKKIIYMLLSCGRYEEVLKLYDR